MKTNPLYMTDPYLKTMDAKILEVTSVGNNDYSVILDQTVFYPMGGGQATDQGTLKHEKGTEMKVYQVQNKDGEIYHFIKSEIEPKVGDTLTGSIDWDRRYKNMKLHSAGHIIDFAMYILGYSPKNLVPVKAEHNKNPHIQYSGILDQDITEELQSKVNEIISKGMNFSWQFESLEELQKEALYLQPGLPTNKPLRVLRLEGVGAVADGGTIVSNTSEVGEVTIYKVEVSDGNTIVRYSMGNMNTVSTIKKEKVEIELTSGQKSILDNVAEEIKVANDSDSLTEVWRKYLGKDGVVTQQMKNISAVAPEERKSFGQSMNQLKGEIDQMISEAQENLKNASLGEYLKTKQFEFEFKKPKIGHIHPLTETINDLNNIFRSLGYSIMDGPEIETDEYCFQRRNVPLDHPARDLQDTIYVEEPNILLRTQTSSIEARAMEVLKPPFKIVMPGRVYRNEKVNRSNHFTFHQYQLSCVQEKVSMAELLATIKYLFKSYLGEEVVIRFRNKYYPEVEPGVGPDMQCFQCHGAGCSLCKGRGWLEMGGAGILHPKVISMAGLDPKQWQGYAFGLGLDRWAMAKHKITDIRTLLGGNLAYKPNE